MSPHAFVQVHEIAGGKHNTSLKSKHWPVLSTAALLIWKYLIRCHCLHP